jgi:thiol-disulfide isomerase/thioredoxin
MVSLVVLLIFVAARTSRAETEPADSSELAQLVAQGDALAAEKHLDKALDAYRKADKFAKHACAACNLRMLDLDVELGDLSAALDDAKRAITAATDNKQLAVDAHEERAALLSEMSGKPTDKKLKEAEDDLRAALAIEPRLKTAHFELGIVLLKQGRDPDGVAELKTFTAMQGADPKSVAVALRDIANPVLAREPIAPDFSFLSFDGERISSETLRGKVVLLDFWATWCPPCRESVPALVRLRAKYAGQPFEIVGISRDHDDRAWQAFIDAHHMDWPDHYDGSGSVSELFSVHAFPTYIVMDREGIMRFRQSGFDTTTPGELQAAIDKALKMPPTAQSTPAPATTHATEN